MVRRWSSSTSNFFCSDWSKFDGWVMREIYAASWDLFTLTAEANRVLCQRAMFLTVFFHWMYKRVFCYSWLVCLLGFWLRNTSIVKVGNPILDGTICKILHSLRGLYDKNSASQYCFTSDAMYKKYKRLVYMPPDLLARSCKTKVVERKKFFLICFQEFVFQA